MKKRHITGGLAYSMIKTHSFPKYCCQFHDANLYVLINIEFADSFEISDSAIKKQQRSFKSVIKLDKNFHIYIHGDREKIQLCKDENGKFYKIYFDKED